MIAGGRRLAWLLLVTAAGGALAAASPTDRQWQALAALLDKQRGIRTLEAQFTQKRELRTMDNPLVSQGRVLYSDDGPQFRFELGSPPRQVALARGDGGIVVADLERRTARRLDGDHPETAAARGLAGIEIPIAKDIESLRRRFAVERIGLDAGVLTLELRPRGRQLRRAVASLEFEFTRASGLLRRQRIQFADGSRLETIFGHSRMNAPLPDDAFALDLDGFTFDPEAAEAAP